MSRKPYPDDKPLGRPYRSAEDVPSLHNVVRDHFRREASLAELASQELGLYDAAYGPCPECGRWMKHYAGCKATPPRAGAEEQGDGN